MRVDRLGCIAEAPPSSSPYPSSKVGADFLLLWSASGVCCFHFDLELSSPCLSEACLAYHESGTQITRTDRLLSARASRGEVPLSKLRPPKPKPCATAVVGVDHQHNTQHRGVPRLPRKTDFQRCCIIPMLKFLDTLISTRCLEVVG